MDALALAQLNLLMGTGRRGMHEARWRRVLSCLLASLKFASAAAAAVVTLANAAIHAPNEHQNCAFWVFKAVVWCSYTCSK